eukprot:TRINITY_DN131_c1_g1_i1.p1 TRINITY_DN131_c1_g1~~TRINITY_DN131_c1_g1_i1.p1  ORF type:complete len:552 (-),score=93.66 TRINITY_DN131_c1_g1_i1:90-1655(-)
MSSSGSSVATSSAHLIEIESGDVIRLIAQFLKENNLPNTFAALQKESQISLNTVENVDNFLSDIRTGRWDSVLKQISALKLPVGKLIDLYELVVLELIELKEIEVARSIMRQTGAMVMLKQDNQERWMKLDHILARSSFDPKEVYPGGSKEKRREQIAEALASEVTVVNPSRLITLLGQALKHQQLQGALPSGTTYDLFRGKAPERLEEERYPRRQALTIPFGKKSHPEVACFSPDGEFLVTGSADGFIEVWDYHTGKLKDLAYQREDKFMMHDKAILSLNFTRDGDHLVTGDLSGAVKVWQVRTGRCLRKLPAAHTKGVTQCRFNKDGFKILTCSYDMSVRLHGLKSGKTLKIFRGHTSFVNDVVWGPGGTQIISAGSDGSVRIWDTATTECVATFAPGNVAFEKSIHYLAVMPRNSDQLLVSNRSSTIYLMNYAGQTLKTFSTGKEEGGDLLAATVSPQGKWIYGMAEDKKIYCFSVESGKLEYILTTQKGEVLGLAHHPHRNLLTTYDVDGNLAVWKA